MSDVLDGIEAVRRLMCGGVLETAPPGYFTVREYAARFGMKHGSAAMQLERLVATGKLKKLRAMATTSAGFKRPGVLYGLSAIAKRSNKSGK